MHGGRGQPPGPGCVCVGGAFLCGWVHVSVMCCASVLDEGWSRGLYTENEATQSDTPPRLAAIVDMRAGESSSNPDFATFRLCGLNSLPSSRGPVFSAMERASSPWLLPGLSWRRLWEGARTLFALGRGNEEGLPTL